MDNLTIEMFSGEKEYELEEFDCGEASLNTFLNHHLKRQHNGKFLRAYVLRTKTAEQRVLGYYTLSGGSFEKEQLPMKSQQNRVPYRNVPSIILGRLAIDKSLQGKGYGELLVVHALSIVHKASQAVGIHGVFVDALNENAHTFYVKLGFIPLVGENARSLFFPTKSIEQMFKG